MKKQTALLLSTLVLMTAVSVQPANAFKLFHKKAKPAVVAPVKKEVAPVKKEVAPVVKTEVKTPATVKPAAKVATPAAKPAAPVAKVAPKAPVKK